MPHLVSSGDTVACVWEDYRGPTGQIYSRTSLDGGSTWGAEQKVSESGGNCQLPWAALAGGQLSVVWQDDSLGNPEIFFRATALGQPRGGIAK